jgi:hypothetical protein
MILSAKTLLEDNLHDEMLLLLKIPLALVVFAAW